MTAITQQTWPLERLIDYARNPRKNDHAVDKVAAAIKEFGFRVPIVAKSDGLVVDGHLRLKAARKLGLAEVPVVLADDLTDAQVKAFRISVNRMAELAEWDSELLALELGELGELGFDLELTGFSEDEANALTPEIVEGKTDPDEAPEPPAKPRSVLGDVWLLGKHRVMCGDSTSIDAVEALMAGAMADLVWTDPPYGVNMASVNESLAKVGKASKTRAQHGLENDDLNDDELTDFLRASLGAAFANCRDGAAWYVAAPAGPLFHCFGTVLKDLDVWRHTLNWIKSSFVLGRSDYHYQHEPIFYGWKPGAAHVWASDRKQSTTLNFDKPSRNGEHPTMKPVELVEYCIGNSSNRGDVVLEPFGGSGTTLIACEKTGRIARLMELDPRYVDVIVKRWQDFTGKKATRESDHKLFDEVT